MGKNKVSVLITGSNGMLGKDVSKVFSYDDKFEIYGINRSINPLYDNVSQYAQELTDHSKLKELLNVIAPDIIIHCAALVNVDACERERELALRVNADATGVLASYKPDTTRLIYISTDSVYDGKKGNYNEHDETNPINYYAYSKLKGEEYALNINKNTLILRTNIFGFHIPAGNSLAEWALERLKHNEEIPGFKDIYFNPIYTGDLAIVIKTLTVEHSYKGILNIGSDGFISKYEFIMKLAQTFNHKTDMINPVSIDEINLGAARPRNMTLNTDRLKAVIKKDILLDEGLKHMKDDYEAFLRKKV